MANIGQDREESEGSQRENQFVNLEQRRDRQRTPSVMVESYDIERIERSPSRTRNHVSHDQETQKLQLEIDHLCKELWRKERNKKSSSPPSSDGSGGSRGLLIPP